jgi:hypothetical protein
MNSTGIVGPPDPVVDWGIDVNLPQECVELTSMLELFLDQMPQHLTDRYVTIVGRASTLLPVHGTVQVGFGQLGHDPLNLSLDVFLVLSYVREIRRSAGVGLLRGELEAGAVLHPEVERTLRVAEDVEEGRERRPPIARQLGFGKLGECLEIPAAGVRDIGEPTP